MSETRVVKTNRADTINGEGWCQRQRREIHGRAGNCGRELSDIFFRDLHHMNSTERLDFNDMVAKVREWIKTRRDEAHLCLLQGMTIKFYTPSKTKVDVPEDTRPTVTNIQQTSGSALVRQTIFLL